MGNLMTASTWVRATLSHAEVLAGGEIAAQNRFAAIFMARGSPIS
jgi:hypothetical protein